MKTTNLEAMKTEKKGFETIKLENKEALDLEDDYVTSSGSDQ